MMSQRALQQSARRIAVKQPLPFATSRFTAPSTALLQIRPATISHNQAAQVPQNESLAILEKQRLKRPLSPHLGIYRPQITWLGSISHRLTGAILSGGLYVFGAGYVVAPLLGLQWGSAAMAASFAKWPLIAKMTTKTLLAFPFVYHSINGLRHLVWDMGLQLKNPQVIRTGWTAVALSAVTTLAMIAFL